VRRCHAFASPRNPNLSILELQLQDITGRLADQQIFSPGKRFNLHGWLTVPGTPVPRWAAPGGPSGLVNGNAFTVPAWQGTPLIEVLEAPKRRCAPASDSVVCCLCMGYRGLTAIAYAGGAGGAAGRRPLGRSPARCPCASGSS